MPLQLGNTAVSKMYLGDNEVTRMYLGDNLVYESGTLPGPSGVLYMVGSTNDALFTLNTSTGVATRVGSANKFGVNERFPSDLAFTPD